MKAFLTGVIVLMALEFISSVIESAAPETVHYQITGKVLIARTVTLLAAFVMGLWSIFLLIV